MRRPRPSLVRRLSFAFVLGQGVAMLLLLFAIYPFALIEEDEPVGPDLVHAALARDLIRAPGGGLAVRGGGDFAHIVDQHPGTWFVAAAGKDRLGFGPVPADLRTSMAGLPSGLRSARFGDLGAKGPAGDAYLTEVETPAGSAIVAAGGVVSASIDFAGYVRIMRHFDFFWAPLLTALLTFAGALFAIPILLRSIRPSAQAAAALDPADLSRRLPEKGVVKQLLPLIRAFNAALDRVAEAFDRRRRFIADVAHELRTPLAVLNMHVDKLPVGEPKADLQRTVFRLGQMVGQMLDAERLALAARRHEEVNLVALARLAVAEIAPLAVSHGYEVAVSAVRDEVIVSGDSHALSRALANLLGNAVAHGGGSGTIEVRVSATGTIDVVDQGPGIAAEAQERVFEPFHRERWDKDGCGLGLHLVREVMQAHGGKARLIGGGPGAVFRLEFPAVQPA
jgi:signal transduction histidine kinase